LKIRWHDKFKDDYLRHKKEINSSNSLKKDLLRAISILEQGKDLSKHYTVNRLISQGQGWFCVYLCGDIILIYKIQSQHIVLARLGTAKELLE